MFKKIKELYSVADWTMELNYETKKVKLIHSDGIFFLDYSKDHENCELREFKNFLIMAVSKIQAREKPIEVEIVPEECRD